MHRNYVQGLIGEETIERVLISRCVIRSGLLPVNAMSGDLEKISPCNGRK
jgi:hypothetical protein